VIFAGSISADYELSTLFHANNKWTAGKHSKRETRWKQNYIVVYKANHKMYLFFNF